MNKEFPLVSVVIPTYNRSKIVRRAIMSVLNQTYRNLECIVVDDASGDDTENVVLSIPDDRLKFIKHEKNKGASATRNTGFKICRGRMIALQDSDDEWLLTKLDKQVKLLSSLPEIYGMVYCWQDYYNNDRLIHEHHKTCEGNIFPEVLADILTGGAQTLLFRKSVLDKVKGFDETLSNGEDDQDFIRRICKNYHIGYVPEVLVKVYVDHDSCGRISDLSSDKNKKEFLDGVFLRLKKFEDDFRKNPRLKASVYTRISRLYAQLGQTKKSLQFLIKAFALYPFSGRVRSSLRIVKMLLSKNH